MSKTLVDQAIAEIVEKLTPEVKEEMMNIIRNHIHLSIHRVAGMYETHPDTIRRHFAKYIIAIGPRQFRIPITALPVVEEILRKQAQHQGGRD